MVAGHGGEGSAGLDRLVSLAFSELFDELRYVVQARYPINAKHRGGTPTKARPEDEYDRVLPAFGRG
jgi:hypothetical protein